MTEINSLSGITNVEMKKKGRKPIQTNYFDVREEQAVVRFLLADTFEDKNKIYNEFLRKPLDKMILLEDTNYIEKIWILQKFIQILTHS